MGKLAVATIGAPEFINITSINPLISKCEVKVLYTGANRNKSFIDKATATAIGQTLPGSPIVGHYRKEKEDFTDHGEQIIFDDEGMKINDLTRPYGFVPTNAKVWFQKFVETDILGTQVEREYLMTEGYLWTGQYEEAKRIYESEDGNPQSMKLHEETLQGHWSKSIKQGVDFFIINDAIIQNLCILGEDTEPCFEGADVTAPKISAHFSKDNNFVTTLFTMMKQLDETLKNEKGGSPMVNQLETPIVEENFSTNEDKVDESINTENQVITEEFAATSDEDKKEEKDEEEKKPAFEHTKEEDEEDKKDVCENSLSYKKEEDDEEKDDVKDKEDDMDNSDDEKDDEEESKKKYSLLEQELNELKSNYAALEESYKELVAFKNAVDDEKKDALINQFYMLSDEDKKEVIENKSNYSLEDIEAKLSVICVRKKVNFDLEDNNKKVEESAPITYNLNSVESNNLPAWLKAVEATKNRNQ